MRRGRCTGLSIRCNWYSDRYAGAFSFAQLQQTDSPIVGSSDDARHPGLAPDSGSRSTTKVCYFFVREWCSGSTGGCGPPGLGSTPSSPDQSCGGTYGRGREFPKPLGFPQCEVERFSATNTPGAITPLPLEQHRCFATPHSHRSQKLPQNPETCYRDHGKFLGSW